MILTVIVAIAILVNLTPVQNDLAHRAASILSKKMKTKVEVAHVHFDMLNHVLLKGVYVEDQNKDTLLYAGELQVRITDWLLNRDKTVLHYLGIKNTYVHLYRTNVSSIWNYAFLEDVFGAGKKPKNAGKEEFEFDLKKIELENVRFHMDDSWAGWDMNYDVASLQLDAKSLDIDKNTLDVNEVNVKGAHVDLKAYVGGRPKQATTEADTATLIDTTPFNPDKWLLSVKKITLSDCMFSLNFDNNIPAPGVFDYNHIVISGISVKINDAGIVGDTIHGNMERLTALERSGIAIRSMCSKISVSPVASICENLLLETNYSKIKNYYAMHYRHFPDFLSYIDSVKMVGTLKDATVDIRDIAFFAPLLKTFPQIVMHANGDGKGTVANLAGYNLNITDGNTAIKGNATIKGLPDIYKSKINFTEGEVFTTGAGILKYVPGLKNSPGIALDKLLFAYFKGTYEGYIDNFSVAGTISSNLGSINTNMKMELPGFNPDSAKYTGDISTENLQLGILLNQQSLLGSVTMNENITGYSFNPNIALVNMDGQITELNIKGYPYRNITTKGILAKQEFNGSLLVDDPNLALEFDGGINFTNKEVNVIATAHLLNCNFKKLLLTEDFFTGSADFDLNCVGSNIDNFSGYARLDNIDIRRNNHKLALDSVFVRATGDSANKTFIVQSNAAFAKIKGNYSLSKLPASFQYYLSGYLPGYISKPQKYAPDQNLEFTINTNIVDSLFAITLPWIRGFDTSYISGVLNTTTQNLSLVANIPYGSIGKVRMSKISISAQGNLNAVSINTIINNVVFADSSISGSLGLTATLGNDSLRFNIATTSPDSSSSIVLNGEILANHDSLFLTMYPSSFYLSQVKWDIGGNCKAIYSDKYLFIDKLNMTSGLQHIYVESGQSGTDQVITINTENLDIGQIGALAGLGYYQPDGRLNGTIKIMNLLQQPYISANLKATGVKFGIDTIGTINVITDYDHAKKLAIIDPQTGIFFNNSSSVTASGKISFDSNTNQKLDGVIQFLNTPVACASPFLTGIFSHISGSLNGTVNIGGRSYAPEIDGTVIMKNAGFHLDYMGTNYKIPTAMVHINNTRIDLGNITAEDAHHNVAYVTGYFSHQLFKDMKMQINVQSDKIEAMKLTKNDNPYFYGNAIVGMDSFTVTGPFSDFSLNAYNVFPAAKSHIYIPVQSTGDVGTYSYISFKTYGKTLDKPVRKNAGKINVNIDANLNELANITILLDPVSGDAIDARGEGNIQLKMPANNDMRITGTYNIESGTYTFSFKQLLNFSKQFKLNSGSSIYFKGPFASTTLDVYATYTAKARLYDLLSASEQASMTSGSTSDLYDAKRLQPVNIELHMQDAIFNPKLSFDLNTEDKSMESNPAYTKLQLINLDDRQKLDQVASLLLTGSFLSQEGLFGKNSGTSLAVNNVSQLLSGTLSPWLTNVVNKATGENKLNINVNYQNYNYVDAGTGSVINNFNRNQVSGTISKNFLNDRLIVEGGAKSDWGTTAGSANYVSQDFKAQYLLTPSGKLRLNCFSTGDFDVTLERNIVRNGVGISWRKSFSNLKDFFTADNKKPVNKIEIPKTKSPIKDSTLHGVEH